MSAGRGWLLSLANADLGDEDVEEACQKAIELHWPGAGRQGVLGYQEIDASENTLGWLGCKTIVDVGFQCQDLRVVKLVRNELTDQAAPSLCHLVEERPCLEQLHLSYNRFTAQGSSGIIASASRARGARSSTSRPGEEARADGGLPLWLRLEHNRVLRPTEALEALRREGVDFCEARDAQKCGPRACKRCALVHLPYFSRQEEAPAEASAEARGASSSRDTGAGSPCPPAVRDPYEVCVLEDNDPVPGPSDGPADALLRQRQAAQPPVESLEAVAAAAATAAASGLGGASARPDLRSACEAIAGAFAAEQGAGAAALAAPAAVAGVSEDAALLADAATDVEASSTDGEVEIDGTATKRRKVDAVPPPPPPPPPPPAAVEQSREAAPAPAPRASPTPASEEEAPPPPPSPATPAAAAAAPAGAERAEEEGELKPKGRDARLDAPGAAEAPEETGSADGQKQRKKDKKPKKEKEKEKEKAEKRRKPSTECSASEGRRRKREKKQAKEAADAKEAKQKDASKDAREAKEAKDTRDGRARKTAEEAKVPKESKQSRDSKSAKGSTDGKDSKGAAEARDDSAPGPSPPAGRSALAFKPVQVMRRSTDKDRAAAAAAKVFEAFEDARLASKDRKPKGKDSRDEAKDSRGDAAATSSSARKPTRYERSEPKAAKGAALDLGNLKEMQKRLEEERNKLRMWVIKAKHEWEERQEKLADGQKAIGVTDDEDYYRCSDGEVFGPGGEFKCEGSIGNGVFSSVFRAKHTAEGTDYAIKFVRANTMMRKAAEKEVETYRKLQRTAGASSKKDQEACQYLMFLSPPETFSHKGHLCMVFALQKCDLRTALQKYGQGRGLPLQTVVQYSRQLFSVLRVLRQWGVIHGDLKPDNVLLSMSKMEIKVCDFGSAFEVADQIKTAYMQPRYYRAPEVIVGHTYDTQVDLWSLAVTLFELASGKILFTGRSNNAMLRQMLEVCGAYPRKLATTGAFSRKHFSPDGDFLFKEPNTIIGEEVMPMKRFAQPNRPISSMLEKVLKDAPPNSDAKTQERLLPRLADLVTKCLVLDPAERATPELALEHSFYKKDR